MTSTSSFCGYEYGDVACLTCPIIAECPKRGKIAAESEKVGRAFIKPCKKQPKTCSVKLCSECCTARENNNLFLRALGGPENGNC